ncbi:MAG: chlorhexidine efflux transporter [Parasphingorhabdus sp.]|uniref:chlorhexidine efflux transporter n=1 Tax=Alphaproteobacteria TaxID=28211 RepID=UPI0032640EC8
MRRGVARRLDANHCVYLEITLLEALMVDLSFALFYMVYAFVFNWAYDPMVPVKDLSPSG